jgi:hypothetical protein
MKIARFFAYSFACIGTVLLLGSMGFFLWNRNAEVRIGKLPEGAVAVADDFAQALDDGDLEAAAKLMYGQPDLGVGIQPADREAAFLWEAFCDSIAFELTGSWQVEQSCLVRTGTLTNLDVSTILGKLPERVQSLLDQKIAAAEELSEIYDAENEFREDLVDAVLKEALSQTLAQDGKMVTREVTIKLVSRDGAWWVVPHQNLLQILSGLT